MGEYIKKEDISRVLLARIGANKSCLSNARELGNHEAEQYFQKLVFEDEQITSLIEGLSSASLPDSAENKGDLISRQAVLDELEKWDWQELYLPIHFKQILDDVPSVENKGEPSAFDGMTNGEVIKALFPNISVYEHGSTYSVNNEYNFNSTWWNAPYQKGGK